MIVVHFSSQKLRLHIGSANSVECLEIRVVDSIEGRSRSYQIRLAFRDGFVTISSSTAVFVIARFQALSANLRSS